MFIIQREAFLKPLRAVAGVVERKHAQTIPILSNVLIKVKEREFSLTATDQEAELVACGNLEEPVDSFEITVPFRKLMDICKALPEGAMLSFSCEQDRVIIRSGRSRFTLSSLSAQDFPSLDPPAILLEVELPKKALRGLIENTCFAMAEQDVRYYLNGLLLEVKPDSITAVAADGHRLALSFVKTPVSSNPLRVIVPRKGILELQRILDDGEEEVKLYIGSNHLRVETSLVTLTTKLLEGKFPEYERIIPKGGDKVVVGERNVLKEAFHRAAALFSDKFRGVRLRLSQGCLKILATNPEQDEVEEDVEVAYAGKDLEIGFNVKYLIDCLTVIESENVQLSFSDSNSSARVEGVGAEDKVFVIMPMRI